MAFDAGRFVRAGLLAAAAALVSAGSALADTAIKFTLDWKFEGPSAPFLIALEKGYYKAEGLDVTIDTGAGSTEALPRVASGAYQMGFGDINSVVKFRDQNPDLDVKAVMMMYDVPPFAIVGRKSLGVTTWQDLKGKKLGAPPPDGAFAQWPAFTKVNGIDPASVTIESIGFPVREPMLAQGAVDAVFGFSFSVFMNLKAAGVPPEDISVILMSKNGLDLYGNAVLVNPAFANENPEAVKGFVKATIKGVMDTVADPDAAVEFVLARNDVAKKEVELERLKMAIADNIATDAVKAGGFGGVDYARLARSIEQIGFGYEFKAPVKAEDVFVSDFLPPAAERMLP
ncbi:ABC transporter substrate-binding protein [Chthonobacter albigriseus]|uniref:ABC transporter substrate-binding protein n=1 Tax=Chthonobacter albigriseus TaxID=1683161 RepID=UPI0015EED04A|nr:ABC transporter substrate-binding protein [Chthonobacter albigriseus]